MGFKRKIKVAAVIVQVRIFNLALGNLGRSPNPKEVPLRRPPGPKASEAGPKDAPRPGRSGVYLGRPGHPNSKKYAVLTFRSIPRRLKSSYFKTVMHSANATLDYTYSIGEILTSIRRCRKICKIGLRHHQAS